MNEDYLYQEELEEAEKKAVLTQLNVAFSRDQDQKVDLTHCFGFQNKPINQAAKRFPVSFLTNWFFFLFKGLCAAPAKGQQGARVEVDPFRKRSHLHLRVSWPTKHRRWLGLELVSTEAKRQIRFPFD